MAGKKGIIKPAGLKANNSSGRHGFSRGGGASGGSLLKIRNTVPPDSKPKK